MFTKLEKVLTACTSLFVTAVVAVGISSRLDRAKEAVNTLEPLVVGRYLLRVQCDSLELIDDSMHGELYAGIQDDWENQCDSRTLLAVLDTLDEITNFAYLRLGGRVASGHPITLKIVRQQRSFLTTIEAIRQSYNGAHTGGVALPTFFPVLAAVDSNRAQYGLVLATARVDYRGGDATAILVGESVFYLVPRASPNTFQFLTIAEAEKALRDHTETLNLGEEPQDSPDASYIAALRGFKHAVVTVPLIDFAISPLWGISMLLLISLGQMMLLEAQIREITKKPADASEVATLLLARAPKGDSRNKGMRLLQSGVGWILLGTGMLSPLVVAGMSSWVLSTIGTSTHWQVVPAGAALISVYVSYFLIDRLHRIVVAPVCEGAEAEHLSATCAPLELITRPGSPIPLCVEESKTLKLYSGAYTNLEELIPKSYFRPYYVLNLLTTLELGVKNIGGGLIENVTVDFHLEGISGFACGWLGKDFILGATKLNVEVVEDHRHKYPEFAQLVVPDCVHVRFRIPRISGGAAEYLPPIHLTGTPKGSAASFSIRYSIAGSVGASVEGNIEFRRRFEQVQEAGHREATLDNDILSKRWGIHVLDSLLIRER